MWSNKSSPSFILYVKNLWQLKKMLDKFLLSWMLQRVFHPSISPLQLLMCASLLSTKLSAMIWTQRGGRNELNIIMDIAFLTCLWYFYFYSFWSCLGYAHNVPRSTDANSISKLNFQRLKVSLLNLSMALAPRPQLMPSYAQRLGMYNLIIQIIVVLANVCI